MAGAAVIYQVDQAGDTIASDAPVAGIVATPTLTADEAAVQGEAAPATVTTSTDLAAADTSLDSAQPDGVISDLGENDTDLSAF